MTHRLSLFRLALLGVMTGVLALTWWGWQNADASLLLLGMRLC
nr:hypothetical protein [Halomonas sp.]